MWKCNMILFQINYMLHKNVQDETNLIFTKMINERIISEKIANALIGLDL